MGSDINLGGKPGKQREASVVCSRLRKVACNGKCSHPRGSDLWVTSGREVSEMRLSSCLLGTYLR